VVFGKIGCLKEIKESLKPMFNEEENGLGQEAE